MRVHVLLCVQQTPGKGQVWDALLCQRNVFHRILVHAHVFQLSCNQFFCRCCLTHEDVVTSVVYKIHTDVVTSLVYMIRKEVAKSVVNTIHADVAINVVFRES